MKEFVYTTSGLLRREADIQDNINEAHAQLVKELEPHSTLDSNTLVIDISGGRAGQQKLVALLTAAFDGFGETSSRLEALVEEAKKPGAVLDEVMAKSLLADQAKHLWVLGTLSRGIQSASDHGFACLRDNHDLVYSLTKRGPAPEKQDEGAASDTENLARGVA